MMKLNYSKSLTAILGITAAAVLAGCGYLSTKSKDAGAVPDTTSRSSVASAPAKEVDHAAMGHGTMSGQTGSGHAMGTSAINALKAQSGKEFDISYLSQMIAHHEAAVVMAKQALKTASKPETKQEAQKVVEAQTKEIAQMTDWLKQWYGVAPSKAQQDLVKTDMQGMMAMPVTSDQMFYEMMIPHHQGAIDMSELVASRTGRPEVKELAEQIIRDQKAEIKAYQLLMGNKD